IEDRVVAEADTASPLRHDLTPALTRHGPGRLSGSDQGDRAGEPRPPGPRVMPQAPQQLRSPLRLRLAEARRVKAREAVESLHLDAAVVADRRRTCGGHRRLRLEGSVFQVSRTCLFDARLERHDLEPGWFEQVAVLAELAMVARRHDEPAQSSDARAFFWAMISSPMPLPASRTIASSSSLLKGCRSAVACSSISRRSSPMTQLRSVSARKSSA